MQYNLTNQEEVPRGRGLRTSQVTPRMQAFRKHFCCSYLASLLIFVLLEEALAQKNVLPEKRTNQHVAASQIYNENFELPSSQGMCENKIKFYLISDIILKLLLHHRYEHCVQRNKHGCQKKSNGKYSKTVMQKYL